MGLIRLCHPFPSLLNATATGVIATLAGAPGPTALRLAASMLALQASIGALNDLRDAALDAHRPKGKPIPLGLVGRGTARVVAAVGLGAGLLLSAPSGWGTVAVAGAGAGLGYAYDVWLSRTAASWLPLALALPLVPVHAWLGATGALPAELVPLVPAAAMAGAALALANGLVDVERDRSSGRPTAAVRLGAGRTWLLHAGLAGGVIGLVPALTPAVPIAVALVPAAALIAVGAWLLRHARAGVRERGWELEAIGVAGLGVTWLAAIASAG